MESSASISTSNDSTIQSVTVVGGTGFVGSRVVKLLSDQGMEVISISKSGTMPEWLQKTSNQQHNIVWKSLDLITCSPEDLDRAMGQPDALISCVGTIGTNSTVLWEGNGVSNVNAFESAQRVQTKKGRRPLQAIAYVSVSSEVKACQEEGWLPEFFSNYCTAKNRAEQSARQTISQPEDDNEKDGRDGGGVGSDLIIVAPTFIYGGDSFGLLPPRVNDAYGSFIDQLLSFGVIQKLADVLPGLIKVALRPPVSVDAVAGACVNGILGRATTRMISNNGSTVLVLDTAKDINSMANQLPATGMNDAIDFTIETTTKTVKWIQEKITELNEKQNQNTTNK